MSREGNSGTRYALGRPARVTFSAAHVVQVHVRGEWQADRRVRVDDGLVKRLLAYMSEQDIQPALPGGYVKPGGYLGYFEPEDAERLGVWLKEQGVEELAPEDQP